MMIRNIVVSSIVSMTLMADMFSSGSASIGAKVGSGTFLNNDYTVSGITLGYFFIDDLYTGVGYTKWFGDDPSIQSIQADATYFLPANDAFKPYLGIQAKQIYLDSRSDTSVLGYRAGLAFSSGDTALSIGWLQEKYNDDGSFAKGSYGYPEVMITIGF